jgi:hypothetical protein
MLQDGPFQSKEEKDYYIRKLYTLLGATNNPHVRDMIRYIEKQYGK